MERRATRYCTNFEGSRPPSYWLGRKWGRVQSLSCFRLWFVGCCGRYSRRKQMAWSTWTEKVYDWNSTSSEVSLNFSFHGPLVISAYSRDISPLKRVLLIMTTPACHNGNDEIGYLEHVVLRITLSYSRRGELNIFLTSPSGTKSNILEKRWVSG